MISKTHKQEPLCPILIHNQELVIFNIMCTSWGLMFTSSQQIVVDSQQGNMYGLKDMEMGAIGMGYQKKRAKLCKQTLIKQNVHQGIPQEEHDKSLNYSTWPITATFNNHKKTTN